MVKRHDHRFVIASVHAPLARQTAELGPRRPVIGWGRGHQMAQRWPSKLWIVRHGESAGNVARDLAHASGDAIINIEWRDIDVPLSSRGEEQAAALR